MCIRDRTYLIDMEGNIVHTWKHDHPAFYAELLPNGNLLRAEKIAGSPVNFGGWYGLLREYAWDGKVVWEYKVSNPRQIAHHGFDRLPNGNTAILIWENKTYDEALAKGRDPKDLSLIHIFPPPEKIWMSASCNRRCANASCSSGSTTRPRAKPSDPSGVFLVGSAGRKRTKSSTPLIPSISRRPKAAFCTLHSFWIWN